MMRFLNYGYLVVLTVSLLACVKIQTGQTVGEAVESNEIRAKDSRVKWRQQLDGLSDDRSRALTVKNYVDSVSAMIIRYGFKIADEWHKGNDGRGAPVDASEMRQVVNSWVATQKPYLLAYEDNIEYGIGLIRETKKYSRFPDEAYNLFDSLAHEYYDTYSSVFFPNENVEFYEETLNFAQRRHRDFSDKLEELIR